MPSRIYVHAGKKFDFAGFNHVCRNITTLVPGHFDPDEWARQAVYPILGAIIGEVDIIDCKFRFGEENDNLYSQWSVPGQYGFVLANPVLYRIPIPCRGQLGFFTPDIEGGVNALLFGD